MRRAGWNLLCSLFSFSVNIRLQTQAGIKIPGRNTNNLRYADDTTLMAESEEPKSLLMKVKEWKQYQTLFLGAPKITADGDCSHEIKRCLLLGRSYDQPRQHIKKQRDITLPTKVHLVKAMVFPVVMYGCESCTIKKAESQKIDAFEL